MSLYNWVVSRPAVLLPGIFRGYISTKKRYYNDALPFDFESLLNKTMERKSVEAEAKRLQKLREIKQQGIIDGITGYTEFKTQLEELGGVFYSDAGKALPELNFDVSDWKEKLAENIVEEGEIARSDPWGYLISVLEQKTYTDSETGALKSVIYEKTGINFNQNEWLPLYELQGRGLDPDKEYLATIVIPHFTREKYAKLLTDGDEGELVSKYRYVDSVGVVVRESDVIYAAPKPTVDRVPNQNPPRNFSTDE